MENYNLYQKHRSLTFDDFVGNESTIKALKKYAKERRFPHVIYFAGLTGSGKTTLSKIIARIVTCKHLDENGNPCNKCKICLDNINDKKSVNFYDYNTPDLGVEDMRDIDKMLKQLPFGEASCRVLFFDELQRLYTKKAAQDFLHKVLERKDEKVFFILGSMNDAQVEKSIKSRGVQFHLDVPSQEQMCMILTDIAEKEGVQINTDDKIKTIVSICENETSMRDAINKLEICIYSDIWNKDELSKHLKIYTDETVTEIISQILIADTNVFKTKFNSELLDNIKYVLLNTYKKQNNLYIQWHENKSVGKLDKFNVELIKYALDKLFELQKYSYNPPIQIEYAILEIIEYARGYEIPPIQQSKTRRKA